MPCGASELERGAICLALFPFTLAFPIERVVRDAEDQLLARLESFDTIDKLEVDIRAEDPGQELVARFKLRPVLTLQDGRDRAIQEIAVARITSLKAAHLAQRWHRRLVDAHHETKYLLPHGALTAMRDAEHGSYVEATKVAVIQKASIVRRVGFLTRDQMEDISERLVAALEIDVSRYVSKISPPDSE